MSHAVRVWWLVAVLLLCTQQGNCRNVTHEDIRDAMLSLVRMIRLSEEKLERHEYREKALGDQLKKMLSGLDKKHRALEPLKGMISRLDERLSNVETILLQKEEREKATYTKTNEALDGIQKSIQLLTASVNVKLSGDAEKNAKIKEDSLNGRLNTTDAKLDAVKREIENLRNSLSKDNLRAMCLDVASDTNPLEKHISEAEKLLNKYELKLNEYNGNITKVQTDFVPLNEVSLADEAWHSKMSEVMERQEKDVKKIQQLLSDAESMWKGLPRIADLHLATNQTLAAIIDSKEAIKENEVKSEGKITTKLREMSDRLVTTNEDIQQSLTQSNTMTERAYNDILRSYDALQNEVKTLTKSENVILQTADNVIATKKRVEYGVHQILVEVGELVRMQGKNLKKSVSERLDNIETSLMANQSVALTNITSKIESEMSQVWRQIGIMHQQLIASKGALDDLSDQSQQYANSSTKTLKKVKEEVASITARMVELGDNMNYVIGRLALVTHEFSGISVGLTQALNDIKTGAKEATSKEKIEDAGPGPHNITSAEKTT